MVDRRVLPGLVAGLAGLAAGVGALVFAVPELAVLAAACALVAGGVSAVHVRHIRAAERDAAGSAALAMLLDLPRGPRGEAADLLDGETGLPDAPFFTLALEGRVAAARRHLWPVTVLLVEVGLAPDCEKGRSRSDALGAFADLMRRTLRESDISCRVGPSRFAVLLDDTGEEGGVWTAERLQVAVSHDVSKVRRMAAGVASYPTHGLEAGEVLGRAESALARACATPTGRGLGQVEVALPDFA
jgi:diguanylate cyclase (GGDEF)-like protein